MAKWTFASFTVAALITGIAAWGGFIPSVETAERQAQALTYLWLVGGGCAAAAMLMWIHESWETYRDKQYQLGLITFPGLLLRGCRKT